jgi:hypothetical protein
MTIHSINTEVPEAREAFLRKYGVRLTWEHVSGDPNKNERVNFRFVMKRAGKEGEAPLVWEEFPYFCGPGCFNGKGIEPGVEDFLACLTRDSQMPANGGTLDDFIDEFGVFESDIEPSGRKGQKKSDAVKQTLAAWAAIEKSWAALERILSEAVAREFVNMEVDDGR